MAPGRIGNLELLFPPLSLLLVSLAGNTAQADGYNRVREVAVPALIIASAALYPALANIPTLLLFAVFRIAGGRKGRYSLTYLGACLGGELGIGIDVAIWKLFVDDAAWSSFHYTLYPWVILGLALGGAALGYLVGRRPPSPAGS